MKVTIINVNLQQGMLVTTDTLQPLAVFSRHHRVVFLLAGMKPSDITIPDEFEHYKIITRFTDSIGLEVWRPDGYVPIHEAVSQYDWMIENKPRRIA